MTTDNAALAALIDTQLPGARLPETPRRFAIFTYDTDDEPELHLWGLALADRAVGLSPSGTTTHRADTAEQMHRLVDFAMDATLVWLDPDTARLSPIEAG